MTRKPHDLLEFLRRASSEPQEPVALEPPPVEAEAPTRMLLVHPRQIWIAAGGAGLVVLLAFLLGLALGGSGDEAVAAPAAKTGVWVVRVISYSDTEQGKINAKIVMAQLERARLGHEVTLQTIPSQNVVVVALGSWLTNPKQDRAAGVLLERVRELRDKDTGERPFHDAKFWLIQR